jgi:hypothetical protein
MTRTSWVVINFLIYIALIVCFTAAQSSVLHWIFGLHATFQMAIVVTTYYALYRSYFEALFFTYLAFYLIGISSMMHEGLAILTGVTLFLGLRAIRTRIYSSNPTYFTWTSLACVLLFHFISWTYSLMFENQSPRIHPMVWIVELLMTSLVTRILYAVFQWLDQKTKRASVSEIIL